MKQAVNVGTLTACLICLKGQDSLPCIINRSSTVPAPPVSVEQSVGQGMIIHDCLGEKQRNAQLTESILYDETVLSRRLLTQIRLRDNLSRMTQYPLTWQAHFYPFSIAPFMAWTNCFTGSMQSRPCSAMIFTTALPTITPSAILAISLA